MRALPLGAVLSLLVISTACGKDPAGDDDAPDGVYEAIELEPAQAALTVALGATGTQTYQVFGLDGGTRTDITATCVLGIDGPFGSFSGATATVRARGGKANVTAACEALGATGTLTINVTGRVVVDPAPANAPELFDTATLGTDGARTPLVEYPLAGATTPKNIPSIDTQWTAAGNDLFHLRMVASFVTVDIYTTAVDAVLPEPEWESVAQTAAGENLQLTVEGLLVADPTTKFGAPPTLLNVSRDDIDRTAIYYWASSVGNIMSQTFGKTTPPTLVKDDCTSCHSLSRSGSRIGYSRCVRNPTEWDCGALFAGFMKYDFTANAWTEPVNANDRQIRGSYTTFSPIGNPFPTDDQSLAIVTMSTGTLALYDPDTGAPVAANLDVANHGPGGATHSALMADWSADGTKVVFASTPNANQWIDLSNGRIAQMTYSYAGNVHTFGEPTFLVADPITLPTGVYNNFFFPSYSPDGAVVVFNAARTGWRGNPARAPGQRLMLADANGQFVVDLAAMNGPADIDVTWAHWAPNVATDYYWVVFSSQRDYGHKITIANSHPTCKQNGVESCKQIWIGAIARNKLTGALTMDPSSPPMWLPGQDPQTTNISPYWTRPVGLQ